MTLQVLIVPDKFKSTLSAGAAARAIGRGWHRARPRDTLELLPMSDGGDGFGEVLRALLSAKARAARTCDAAHRPCTARWWWEPKTKTAILESARVVGLAMLPPGRFHPFDLDTRGLGILLQTVARMGARRCLVGLGGSATNDGGFGLARALGWEFLDREGRLIERWTGLSALARIRAPKQRLQFKQVAVAVDVQNPLLGARGATRVYGPQKGLAGEDFRLAEKCLRRLAQVINKDLGCDLACVPGAGAAGGLGFGFLAFLGARLESGFELFSCYANLERRLKAADVVITGEGSIDHSTLMGKGAGEIARRCQKLGIPCIGLTGVASKTIAGRKAFTQVRALTELTTLRQARARPAFWLEQLSRRVAARWLKSAG